MVGSSQQKHLIKDAFALFRHSLDRHAHIAIGILGVPVLIDIETITRIPMNIEGVAVTNRFRSIRIITPRSNILSKLGAVIYLTVATNNEAPAPEQKHGVPKYFFHALFKSVEIKNLATRIFRDFDDFDP